MTDTPLSPREAAIKRLTMPAGVVLSPEARAALDQAIADMRRMEGLRALCEAGHVQLSEDYHGKTTVLVHGRLRISADTFEKAIDDALIKAQFPEGENA